MKWLKDRLSIAKVWAIKQWVAFTVEQKNWIATYEKRAFLILVSVILGLLSLWLIPEWQASSYRERFDSLGLGKTERIQLEKDLITTENNARVTIAQIIGGLVVLLGLYATFKNVWVAEEGKLTERFSKAVELLGDDKLDIRLGGIYAHERIARDSQKDHWTVMEVLTAFVREQSRKEYGKYIPNPNSNSAIPVEDDFKLREDIQAALTVICRRKWFKQETHILDLSKSFLGRVVLYYANLSGASLSDVNLNAANLAGADLIGVNLDNANLTDAILLSANLTGANLLFANLTGADFRYTKGLTWEQISKAIIDKTTKLPPELEERRKAEQGKKAAAPNQ